MAEPLTPADVRGLVRDPDLTTLKVAADPATVEPGRPVGVLVTARMPDYRPASEATVKVDLFSVKSQRVIASQTGLTGGYNIDLQYTPEALSAAALAARVGAPPPLAAQVDPKGPDLFTAMQEQL